MKADVRMMHHLPAKTHQRLPAKQQKLGKNGFPLAALEGISPANTFNAGF